MFSFFSLSPFIFSLFGYFFSTVSFLRLSPRRPSPFPRLARPEGMRPGARVGLSHDCLFTVAMCPPSKPKCASVFCYTPSYFPVLSCSAGVFLCLVLPCFGVISSCCVVSEFVFIFLLFLPYSLLFLSTLLFFLYPLDVPSVSCTIHTLAALSLQLPHTTHSYAITINATSSLPVPPTDTALVPTAISSSY